MFAAELKLQAMLPLFAVFGTTGFVPTLRRVETSIPLRSPVLVTPVTVAFTTSVKSMSETLNVPSAVIAVLVSGLVAASVSPAPPSMVMTGASLAPVIVTVTS